jgi:hypothetical protein
MSLPGVPPSATRVSDSRPTRGSASPFATALPCRVGSLLSGVAFHSKNSNGCATAGLFLIEPRKRHTSGISDVQTLTAGLGLARALMCALTILCPDIRNRRLRQSPTEVKGSRVTHGRAMHQESGGWLPMLSTNPDSAEVTLAREWRRDSRAARSRSVVCRAQTSSRPSGPRR